MKTNRWIALSQHLYGWLLRLYPQAHRTAYASEMFHVFTDQCREAYARRGRLAMLSLWWRTLMDVGVTAVREHLSDPQARVGLLDPMPNAPLPWKGVLLVSIPGLIFFVGQIEQVTSGNDWFFLAFYRAGYFLILPVLLVWVLARRFPIWGLIPLGLLYETLWAYGRRVQVGDLFFVADILKGAGGFSIYAQYVPIVLICIVSLAALVWRHARRGQISRGARKWLGLYGLLVFLQLVALQMAGEVYRYMGRQGQYMPPADPKEYLFQTLLWYLYDSLPFLLLVFIGMFFARRHGGLTFLLLLGYLLPTIVFGRYSIWNDPLPLYLISLAVVAYRFLVALVAPVWLVRAASLPGRQRAAAIPVAMAIVSQIFLTIVVILAVAARHVFHPQPVLLDCALAVWSQLIVAAGLGLAVTLYLPGQAEQPVVPPPTLVALAE
jgi:hypothetical protein